MRKFRSPEVFLFRISSLTFLSSRNLPSDFTLGLASRQTYVGPLKLCCTLLLVGPTDVQPFKHFFFFIFTPNPQLVSNLKFKKDFLKVLERDGFCYFQRNKENEITLKTAFVEEAVFT